MENDLKTFFTISITEERKCTSIRETIIFKTNPYALFTHLCNRLSKTDPHPKLTIPDFQSLFPIISSDPSNFLFLKQVINNYDKDHDYSLNQNEFVSFILPNHTYKLFSNNNSDMPNEVMTLLSNLIQREIYLTSNTNEIIEKLRENKDFNTYDLFRNISGDNNINNNKYINAKDLFKYLKFLEGEQDVKNEEITFTEQDAINFICRYNRENNYFIGYNDFREIFYFDDYIDKENKYTFDINKYINPSNTKFVPRTNPGELYFNYSLMDSNLISSQFKNSKLFNSYNSYSSYNSLNNFTNLNTTQNSISYLDKIYPDNAEIKSTKKEKEKKLYTLLKLIYDYEVKYENIKQLLSCRNDVCLQKLFSFFDINKKLYIEIEDIKTIMKNVFGILTTEEDIYFIFKLYDKDNDGKLDFDEFCSVFKPRSQEHLRLINCRKCDDENYFSEKSKEKIKNLICTLMEGEKNIDRMKVELSSYPDFSYYECFELIKRNNYGDISKYNIINFFKDRGILLINLEVELFFSRFDCLNCSGIGFNKFIKCLEPIGGIE